jgi:hypothetical protein
MSEDYCRCDNTPIPWKRELLKENSSASIAGLAVYKTLGHGSTVIVITDGAEFAYIQKWCESQGKRLLFNPKSFPICVSVADELVGWTDHMDRALYYKSFDEFLCDIKTANAPDQRTATGRARIDEILTRSTAVHSVR